MQIKLNILTAFLVLSVSGFAQRDSSGSFLNSDIRENFYMMGGLGLYFGDETYINLAPVLAYRFTEELHGGVGIGYSYYNNAPIKFSTNIYQGSIFGRYFIFEKLFAHVEFEKLFLQWSDGQSYSLENYYVGGGFNQPLGGNAFAGILLLYNLNSSPYSPYPNPIIRAGIGIGL